MYSFDALGIQDSFIYNNIHFLRWFETSRMEKLAYPLVTSDTKIFGMIAKFLVQSCSFYGVNLSGIFELLVTHTHYSHNVECVIQVSFKKRRINAVCC